MPTAVSTFAPPEAVDLSQLSPGDRRVLSEIELATRWGISPKTLQRWRLECRGPQYLKLSKRVNYPLESVLVFEREALHASTSERVYA